MIVLVFLHLAPLPELEETFLEELTTGLGVDVRVPVRVELDIPYLQLGTLAPGISICGLTAGLEGPLSAETEGHRSNLS